MEFLSELWVGLQIAFMTLQKFQQIMWHFCSLSFINHLFVSCRLRNHCPVNTAQYSIMFLSHFLWWSNLTICKYFLVLLYLLCTSQYHKLLTNNRFTVSVAFFFPKTDIVASFQICLYFPNLHFPGSSHLASQHALTCSCLNDNGQHERWCLITHLTSLGSHRPGPPPPAPPAEPISGWYQTAAQQCGQECATAFLPEGTVPYLR